MPSERDRDNKKGASLIVTLVAATFFMENLDGKIIATALPQMARSFDVHLADMSLGITPYLLTLAVFIPISGWAADRFGLRTVFGSAIAVFRAASVLCATTSTLPAFAAARVLQGIGGAMMVPVGRLAVLRATPKEGLMRAIAIITWPGLVAPVIGPPLGGFITTYLSWRWIFYLNVPLGLIGLLLTLRHLQRARGPEPPVRSARLRAVRHRLHDVALRDGADRPQRRGLALRWPAGGGGRARGLRVMAASAARGPSDGGSVGVEGEDFCHRDGRRRLALSDRDQRGAVPVAADVPGRLRHEPVRIGLAHARGVRGQPVDEARHHPGDAPVRLSAGVDREGRARGIVACGYGLLTPTTPKLVIVVLLFASGLSRSLQFTALNTLSFADVPKAQMSGASALSSTLFQMTMGIGVAVGAIALRIGEWAHGHDAYSIGPGDFSVAFLIVGFVGLVGVADLFGLARDAGALVSGHGKRKA